MDNGAFRILRWVLIALGVLLVLFILILLFTKPSENKQGDSGGDTKNINLKDYSQNGSFRFVQNGTVTAPEKQRSVTIAISNSTRTITVYGSYGAVIVSDKSYSNSQSSFDAFTDALIGAGFTNVKSTDLNYSNYCTLGVRFSYQVIADNNIKLDTWNSTCNLRDGTFDGNNQQVQQLFKNQIPDYNQIMNSVRLN